MSIQTRPALLSDARDIAEVHVRTWRAAYRGIVPDAFLDALSVDKRESAFRDALARGSPEMWVAHSESEILGWIAFGAARDADATPKVGEIEAIYISPAHWSNGAGKSLWHIARARLLERGFESVTLWVLEENERGILFYRAAGFAPDATSRKQIAVGGKSLWEIRYTRTLNE